MKRLKILKRKLDSNKRLLVEYDNIIKNQFHEGIIEKVTSPPLVGILLIYLNVLFRAYGLIIKRITRSAIIVEINTKDVKLVKANISSLHSKRHLNVNVFWNVFWKVKTKY